MEEEQEFKQHVCKFCRKSFSCGRSLGGHMRSHMIDDISAQADGSKLTKKKLPSLTNYNHINTAKINKHTTTAASTEISGYGLRGNLKKTWRSAADHLLSSEDTLLVDKSCKECGRLFHSWKALFGHMKSHSLLLEKEKVSNKDDGLEAEQQDCCISADNQKLIMHSHSDNETVTPNRRKRSKRRTRYMGGTANSSSLYFANNNDIDDNHNASSSVSEIDRQEQEEVALCLMMLSRDVGNWVSGLNFVAESSDNNSVFLENPHVSSMKLKAFGKKKSEVGKVEDDDSKVESRRSELSVSGIARKEFTRNNKVNDESAAENSVVGLGKNMTNHTPIISSSCKRKLVDFFDPESNSDHFQNPDKGIRFECTTCNKVFNSYQALGGHRASHKRTKPSSGSRIDSSFNSIETELSPDPTVDSKLIINSIKNEISDSDNKAETSYGAKKSKRHECPICLKVFSSGQALGGHKRSHLVTGTAQTNSIQESIPPPIREFLDLNLPAPVEEQTNGLVSFKSWWISSSQNHEHLAGLISN